jgi:GNAT superfamily N-acetyltransferase
MASSGTMADQPVPRIATEPDLETATEIIARSFSNDPVWGRAYPPSLGDEARRAIWRFEVGAAMRLGWTWLSAGAEATAVWIPPAGSTFDAAEMRAYLVFLAGLLGPAFDRVAALHERFEAAEPKEPHYYLSLLGTHPDHRGQGHGMRLLADNLATIDAEGVAAYLESTNPANDARYASVGFERLGSFEGFVPGSVITTMWRPARG